MRVWDGGQPPHTHSATSSSRFRSRSWSVPWAAASEFSLACTASAPALRSSSSVRPSSAARWPACSARSRSRSIASSASRSLLRVCANRARPSAPPEHVSARSKARGPLVPSPPRNGSQHTLHLLLQPLHPALQRRSHALGLFERVVGGRVLLLNLRPCPLCPVLRLSRQAVHLGLRLGPARGLGLQVSVHRAQLVPQVGRLSGVLLGGSLLRRCPSLRRRKLRLCRRRAGLCFVEGLLQALDAGRGLCGAGAVSAPA